MKLRPYQEEAINIIEYELSSGNNEVVLSAWTSFGKSLVIAQLAKNLSAYTSENKHIIICVTVKTLFDQLSKTLNDFGIEFNKLNAKTKQTKFNKKIILAMSQTLHKRLGSIDISVEYMLQDEAHIEWNTDRTKAIIKSCNVENRIGFTATPYTGPGYMLENNPVIINTVTPDELEAQKYITPIRFFVEKNFHKVNLDDAKVGSSGEFEEPSIEKIYNTAESIKKTVEAMNSIDAKNKKTIVFASSIDHANRLAKALSNDGYLAISYHSELPDKEAEKIIDGFRTNLGHKCLVSVAKIRTGFDVPDIELGVFARAVNSPGLYRQMCGRLCRLAAGKEYAIMLDLGRNVERLGFPNELFSPVEKGERKELLKEITKHQKEVVEVIDVGSEPREITIELIEKTRESITRKKQKKLYEISTNDLKTIFKLETNPTMIIGIGFEMQRRFKGISEINYTESTIRWASQGLISMLNKYPELQLKILKAFKTRIKNIVMQDKKMAGIKYFGEWLENQEPYCYYKQVETGDLS